MTNYLEVQEAMYNTDREEAIAILTKTHYAKAKWGYPSYRRRGNQNQTHRPRKLEKSTVELWVDLFTIKEYKNTCDGHTKKNKNKDDPL